MRHEWIAFRNQASAGNIVVFHSYFISGHRTCGRKANAVVFQFNEHMHCFIRGACHRRRWGFNSLSLRLRHVHIGTDLWPRASLDERTDVDLINLLRLPAAFIRFYQDWRNETRQLLTNRRIYYKLLLKFSPPSLFMSTIAGTRIIWRGGKNSRRSPRKSTYPLWIGFRAELSEIRRLGSMQIVTGLHRERFMLTRVRLGVDLSRHDSKSLSVDLTKRRYATQGRHTPPAPCGCFISLAFHLWLLARSSARKHYTLSTLMPRLMFYSGERAREKC